jgi:predicted kinase
MNFQSLPPLVMLVGPTGAGKSTWAKKHFKEDEIISSDDIRIEFGEARGLTRYNLSELLRSVWELEEPRVKREYRSRIESALRKGNRVVAEATHLRTKDRISVANIAHSLSIAAVYVVFNRSLEDKWETAGWRADFPTLIAKQQTMFEQSEAAILVGDGIPEISVMDTRKQT